MRCLVGLTIIVALMVSGLARAEVWFGPEVVFLKPGEGQYVGWGINGGAVFWRHFELSFEGSQVFSKKGVTDSTTTRDSTRNFSSTHYDPKQSVVDYNVGIKPSFRFRAGSSFYLGIGLGYNARIKHIYSTVFIPSGATYTQTTQSFTVDFLLGYHFPISPHYGFRLEGKYRALSYPDNRVWLHGEGNGFRYIECKTQNSLQNSLIASFSFVAVF